MQEIEAKEAGLLQHIGVESIHIDELRRQAEMPVANVRSTLSPLEKKVGQAGRHNPLCTCAGGRSELPTGKLEELWRKNSLS